MDSKTVQQFKKGSLEMILLCLIGQGETYGYELISALNDSGAAVLGYAREGTVYPMLYRLQQQNLITCRIAPAAANGGTRRVCRALTAPRAACAILSIFLCLRKRR